MSKSIQAIRGMKDLLPNEVELWQQVEEAARSVLSAYGYEEIRFPIIEKTELFARSIGQVTDIVEKEMYSFEDRNGDSLSLRPEGTASCVRAGIENGILHNQIRRLWYQGAMFRHERPQKGRYRQFHQIGVEHFGVPGPAVDAELIILTQRLWQRLGIDTKLRLVINTLGDSADRAKYRSILVEYMRDNVDRLDSDSIRRLEKNPLRILDSKNPSMKNIIAGAPMMFDYLDDYAKEHFQSVLAYMDDAGIKYDIVPNLVRGLDYYCHTVFEWVTDELGAQDAICAGGRYDGLVEQLGGKATPAAGFAIGMERLIALYEQSDKQAVPERPHVYLVLLGDEARRQGLRLAESLRDRELRVICHCDNSSMKAQIKHADRSQARYAVIIGREELKKGVALIKNLREDKPQESIKLDKITEHIEKAIG